MINELTLRLQEFIEELTECTRECDIRFESWSKEIKPEDKFILFIISHRGHAIPLQVPRIPEDQMVPTAASIVYCLYQIALQGPGWHAHPGSEENWREWLKAIRPEGAS